MSLLDRYQSGEHVAVWNELMALRGDVRKEPNYSEALAVAGETMRRARHNVELLIRRLDAAGYRFQDEVSSAEDQLSRLNMIGQLSQQLEEAGASEPGRSNPHVARIINTFGSLQTRMAPLLERAAAKASRTAARSRKPPLEDANVFSPPGKETAAFIGELEKSVGGPLPLSLRAWFEQVGGLSLMGSHPVLNPVGPSFRESRLWTASPPQARAGQDFAPEPMVIYPVQELLDQMEDRDAEDNVELVIAPDDLHKANISGDACYLSLPDFRADFDFDDWHHTTFVNYLRISFQWGGFPGWARYDNPPLQEIAALAEGLLPI